MMNDIDVEKYRDITFVQRKCCEICNTSFDNPIIKLPDFPMTEIYTRNRVTGKAGICDQAFYLCRKCGHGQLQNVLDMELQYGNSIFYHFRTSQSSSGKKSADFFISFLLKTVGDRRFRTIIELGSNDLYVLKEIKDKAEHLIGIDPILKGQGYSDDKITAIGDYFENVRLDKEIDLVICKDTLEHVAQPRKFVEQIVQSGQDDTLYVFEFPLLNTLVQNSRFDQIFHQHLNYFSYESINYMLNELDCELIAHDISYQHWGGILIAFKKIAYNKKRKEYPVLAEKDIINSFNTFQKNMEVTRERLLQFRKEKLIGYGAALMLPVLAYHLKTDFHELEFILDDDKNKEGTYYINLPVKIRHTLGAEVRDATILLTAISSKHNVRSILSKLIEKKPRNIIIPMNII
jgi:hypothetical protein